MAAVPVVLGQRSGVLRVGGPVPQAPPGSPDVHPFRSTHGHHVLVADGSRLYDIDEALHTELAALIADGSAADALRGRLQDLGLASSDHIGQGAPAQVVDVRYASLAVAQSCNLGCTYCYADGGDFGGTPAMMPLDVAYATVDRLLADADPGGRIGLAFIGGEPLLNRRVIGDTVAYAAERAEACGVEVTFSITTNATLLTAADVDLFDEHGFAVTVSIDGLGEVHDALRPTRSGEGTWDRIMARVQPMLARQGRMQVSARASITPANTAIRTAVAELLGMGFHSVGVAPVLRSPNGSGELDPAQLDVLLAELKATTVDFRAALDAGQSYRFSNITSALQMIHRGTHRPYPCGAGGAYLGVGADGSAAACHRFVGDDEGAMGSVDAGWDHAARAGWAADRHVDRQEPCRSCWARYLCGGGCHHEVIGRGRTSCDFIRAWLEHCLATYVEVANAHPRWFA
ncbi:MAG: radical SAM protein [Actinomycetota bacterium]